jgi:hypothetical protein
MKKTEQPVIEQPWQRAMRLLIARLKKTDKSFNAGPWDRHGMLNFSRNVKHPAWKIIIERPSSQKHLQVIQESLEKRIAA